MATKLTHRKVLLASPSDVKAERNLLRKAVLQWNKVHGETYGVYFIVIGYEEATPGKGEEAQAVVTDQIAKDFEVFACIIWTRIGSPTKKAESGTVAEYEEAIKKWEKDKNSVRFLIYFKTAPFTMDQIDGDQINAVKNFKERVHDDGILYSEFGDGIDFYDQLNMHLTGLAKDYEGFNLKDLAKTAPAQNDDEDVEVQVSKKNGEIESESIESQANDEEGGILDYEEMLADATEEFVPLLEQFGIQINSVGTESRKATAKLKMLPNDATAKQKRTIIQEVADSLNQCSEFFQQNIGNLQHLYSKMTTSTLGLIETAEDFAEGNLEEFESLYSDLQVLHSTMIEAADEVSSLSIVLAQIPRMARVLNVSKRRLSLLLDEFSSATYSAASLFEAGIQALEQLLTKHKD